MAEARASGRCTKTARSPPVSVSTNVSSVTMSNPIPPVPVVPIVDETPFISRRSSKKRLKADFPEDENVNVEQLSGEINVIKKLLISCETNIKLLVRENSVLKTELSVVKEVLMTMKTDREKSTSVPVSAVPVSAVSLSTNNESTFASVVKNSRAVLIKPKSPKTTLNTHKLLRENINPKDYAVSKIKATKNGGIVIECQSSAERDKLVEAAIDKLGNNCDVSKPTTKCPRIRLVGLSEQPIATELLTSLKKQNTNILCDASTLNVAHTYAVKSKSQFGAILEVDVKTFRKILDEKKLYVGWDACMAYEDLNIRRCYKCWGFNHVAAKCSSDQHRCSKCSGNHHFKDCTSAEEKCAACIDAAHTLHLQIDTKHAATSLQCPTYLHRVEAARRTTDFAI